MAQRTKRETENATREGFGYGVIAGILLAIAAVIAALIGGTSPLMPFRMFASVLLGSSALDTVAPATAVVVGGIIHLLLSGVFGVLYAALNARLPLRTQTHFGKEAGLGALFGVALWFVNIQIIARILYPWFLDAPQFTQMLMHALVFGLPLGLMYARLERRLHPIAASTA